MMIYLIPNTLGPGPLETVLTDEVRQIVSQLEYFIAENAKSARAFLKLVAQTHPLRRPLQEIDIRELNVNTPASALPDLLAPVMAGNAAGLLSEAGVPAVADPGANLVRLAHEHKLRVRPLVGPSSLLLALMASGLDGQRFTFHGYLPVEPTARAQRIRQLEQRSRQENQTQIFIETPYRNGALLEALVSHCAPDTRVCVATDLTLASEVIATYTVKHWKSLVAREQLPDFHKKPSVFLMLAAD